MAAASTDTLAQRGFAPPVPAETNAAARRGTATANVPQRTPSNTRMPHNARLASAPMRCNAWQVHPETVHAPDHQLPAPGRRPAGHGADLPIHRRQRQQGIHQPAARRGAGADRRTAADQYRRNHDTPEKSSAGNAPAADSEAAAYEILALSDLPTRKRRCAPTTAPSTSASASARPCTAATSCNWCWTANPTARPAAAPASPCTRSTAATTASRYRYSTANGCCNPARR